MAVILGGAFSLLELPFEVRQAIYEQLLANVIIHACPDEGRLNHSHASTSHNPSPPIQHRNGRTPGNFDDDLMECSNKHYQTLVKPGKWSNVCSPRYDYQACDILHFMLVCKKTYLELEPLLWSKLTLAVGLPFFGLFFERYLSLPLRSQDLRFVARASVLQKLILSLARIDELASEMGHDPSAAYYYQLDAYGFIQQRVKRSLDHVARSCPSLRSIQVIIDATQLQFDIDPHQIIAYARPDVEDVLKFPRLEDFKVTYSGKFSSEYYQDINSSMTIAFDHQLEACERALWEMVTKKGEPLDPKQDCTGWLGDRSMFEDIEPRLKEFCERAVRHYNIWWMSLNVKERMTIYGDSLDEATLHG